MHGALSSTAQHHHLPRLNPAAILRGLPRRTPRGARGSTLSATTGRGRRRAALASKSIVRNARRALQQIVQGAPAHLAPGGWLLLEHGFDQADAVRDLLRRSNFDEIATRADLAGRPRCSGGRRRKV